MKKCRALLIFTVVSWLAFASSLLATVVLKMDIPELVRNSCSIVIGEVVEIEKNWESIPHPEGAEVINVTLEIKVVKTLKACPHIHRGDLIPVKRIGGRIEEVDMMVPGAPTFRSKTKVLLFLAEMPDGEHIITGFSQGKFRILKDSETGEETAVQDKNARALLLIDEATGKPVEKSLPDEMPLQELLNEIDRHVLKGGS